MQNCDVMVREDITVDQFIDVVLGNRKYVPCLYVYNKSTCAAPDAFADQQSTASAWRR